MPNPIFSAEGIMIYHSLWEDVELPLKIAACITDPPYGISLPTANSERMRGGVGHLKSQEPAPATDYAPIYNDDKPFDPAPLLGYPVVVLFGGNHYCDKLPISGNWVVWDKIYGLTTDKREVGFNDNADAELIWTNQPGQVRILRHQWNGLCKASERGENRVHPSQKPVELMMTLVRLYTKPGDLVFDPYMGSGPLAVACYKLSRKYLGCEVVKTYADIAVGKVKDAMGGGVMTGLKLQLKRRIGKRHA